LFPWTAGPGRRDPNVQQITRRHARIVGLMNLRCAECLLLADDGARGGRLLRVDVPGEDDEPLLAAYCPVCADREFGLSRRMGSGQADAQ
jgi:hypothetical protein